MLNKVRGQGGMSSVHLEVIQCSVPMIALFLENINMIKVVYNNCKTVALMFNRGSCSSSICHSIDTKICTVLLQW